MSGSGGCYCQDCDVKYTIDVMVDDDLWEQIKPDGAEYGAGLLCPGCIFEKLEELLGYAAFQVERIGGL